MKRMISICIFVLMVWNLSGCALFKLREDVRFSHDSCLLTGEVISRTSLNNPIVIVAYSRKDGAVALADYTVLSEPGQYEMLVPQGDYEIFAFEDKNGNLNYDSSEWADRKSVV